jgi:hypothetical protein
MTTPLSNIYNHTYEYANTAVDALENAKNSTVKFLSNHLPEELTAKISQLGRTINQSDLSLLIKEQGTSPAAIGVTLMGLYSGSYLFERPLITAATFVFAFLLTENKNQMALLAGSTLVGRMSLLLY